MIIYCRVNVVFAIELECCFQFWVPQYRNVADLIERVLQIATKMIRGLSWEKRLRELELFNLRREDSQGDLINVCGYLTGGNEEEGDSLSQ